MSTRRDFLRTTAIGTAGLALTRFSLPSRAQSRTVDSRLEVLLEEPLGTINPNIYGHFAENLGGVLYDGLWVGENSKVPNVGGLRKAVIDHMRKIKAPVIRFPGGCFADTYDWRDGIGPREKRPRRPNFWGNGDPRQNVKQKYDPNEVGTDEFLRFCREIGAQGYLAANVRSLPAVAFQQWVDYCNSPAGSTTLADQRAANGSREPYKVEYWGVGNESWGCGGNFEPEEYAMEFRRYATWVPGFGMQLKFIASGPNVADYHWTSAFCESMQKKSATQMVYGLALHHYAWNLSMGKTDDWDKGKGDALEFSGAEWYELMREGQRMEDLIERHWRLMGESDREHQMKLIVDEWGPWYRPGSEATPGDVVEQTPTLRDAVFSGMTLDIFNRHPEKVAMANCAQLINCLNSLYLAHEDKFVVTPVGHVFDMYSGHQGGQALRMIVSSPEVNYERDGKPATFWGLQGAASLKGKKLFLTAVNPDTKTPRETEIAIRGASAGSATMTVLSAPDIHAHNTFDHPNAVAPQRGEAKVANTAVSLLIPPASVVAIELTLL